MDTVYYHFLVAFLVYLLGGFPVLAYALPQGGTVSSGAATIDTSGSSLTVTQTSNKIIINQFKITASIDNHTHNSSHISLAGCFNL